MIAGVKLARGVPLVGLAGLLLLPVPAGAQTPPMARLVITVVDQTGAVIPGATVTVTGLEDATRAATPPPGRTSDRGVSTFERLAPGRYTLQAEFAGFETRILKDVRLRAGENRHVLLLSVKSVQEAVTVDRDRQAAAADPRGRAFGTVLTREEIMALSDDPDEMRQQLLDMVGPGAIIRVDSFEGGRLPPKAQIKSIRITRDNFAAENHSAERDGIDITTQPGIGPLRATVNSRFRDGSMSGRSPFTPTKGPERSSSFESNLAGTLVKDRSSFSIAVGGQSAFDSPNLNAALPGGVRAEVLNLRRPNHGWGVNGLFDYALTPAQALRISYGQNFNSREALGVGQYDLPERAYATESHDHTLRVLEVGQLGRRMFSTARLQIRWADTESRASLEAPTIRVSDAFTSGGAQVAGGRHARDLTAAWDVDYVRGLHTIRTGAVVDHGRYRADDAVNYLGTYVFTSLDAYSAGLPKLYLRRIGDPLITYSNTQVGLYIQDDIRVRKGLAISPGVRYEAQTHVADARAFGPRVGAQWAPFASGRTILRGSWAMFYNWLSTGVYEQTLRVDGIRQRELNIVNPAYPDPASGGVVPPTNRYLLGQDFVLPRLVRVSIGVDQTLTPRVRVTASYSYVDNNRLAWGRNLNAPVQGVRPDAAFANVVEVQSGGRFTNHQLAATLALNLNTPASAAGRFNWRRTTVNLSYFLGRTNNDTDGAFAVPPSGTLGTEWGPALNDRRHRVSAVVSTQAVRNLSVNLNLAANTGTPYTVTTGFDDNGDSIFNDRPAGLGRGTARAAAFATWNLNATYAIGLGPPAAGTAGDAKGGPARYRVSWTLTVTNLTNRANYIGYSGVMTSPFFQQPTSVQNPRKIDLGMAFSF